MVDILDAGDVGDDAELMFFALQHFLKNVPAQRQPTKLHFRLHYFPSFRARSLHQHGNFDHRRSSSEEQVEVQSGNEKEKEMVRASHGFGIVQYFLLCVWGLLVASFPVWILACWRGWV